MKILVVDDMEEGRIFLQDLILYMGHEAFIAENGRLALELMAVEEFDLVISDILMPVMDGYQLCKAIKSDKGLSRTPLMFLTGTYTEAGDEELARRMGAETLVRKPIEVPKLMGLIGDLLSRGPGETTPAVPVQTDEQDILDLYSRRLIHQLEKKMVELEAEIRIRERKEEDLKRSRQQLRDLSAHLQTAIEQERTHLAREIHDELGQALTVLRMDAIFIESRADRAIVTDRVRKMIEFIDSTAKTVQSICSELRPSILDDLGLTAAMEWLIDEFRKRSDIRYDYSFNPEEMVLPRDISTAAFRILQETLTNVSRHAGAREVMIKLEAGEKLLTMTVKDDGRGITEEEIDRLDSFGLLGMKERALNLGGNLEITGDPGSGTEVRLTIALPTS